MTGRVVASALPDFRAACWLACPAGSFAGVQGCGTARAAARGRGTAPHLAEAAGLGPPGGAGRADQAPAGKAAGDGWSRRAPSCGGTVAWSPGSGPIRAARDARSGRGVLCRAVIGVQGGSRSKRQGWTRPAGRDGVPLADVTAVRGAPCAFAPGVAGRTAPLPQAGRGEHRCRRGTFTCAAFACATSPGAG